jgi:hypothetical protein
MPDAGCRRRPASAVFVPALGAGHPTSNSKTAAPGSWLLAAAGQAPPLPPTSPLDSGAVDTRVRTVCVGTFFPFRFI